MQNNCNSASVEMEDTPIEQQNVCRVGISRGDDSVRNLGETDHSFGFGGTGKFSNSGNFVNYGQNFGVGDTIVCAVDHESRPMASIAFLKNGKWLGVAVILMLVQVDLGCWILQRESYCGRQLFSRMFY